MAIIQFPKHSDATSNAPLWHEAFYDRDYRRDQTRRMEIFDSVVEFLASIDCQVKWTRCHDGSDYDPDYGIFISRVSYQGKDYEHNACYQISSELPAELLEKLDAKFGAVTKAP